MHAPAASRPPATGGFFHAHLGWLLSDRHTRTALEEVPDLASDPLLRWLDRWHLQCGLIKKDRDGTHFSVVDGLG